MGGGAEDEAGERGVLEAADRRQHAERVGRVGPVPGQAVLAPPSPCGSARPGVRVVVAVGPLRSSQSRAVRDAIRASAGAVFPMPMPPAISAAGALVDGVVGRADADLDRGEDLVAGERRLGGEVPGAGPDLADHQAGTGSSGAATPTSTTVTGAGVQRGGDEAGGGVPACTGPRAAARTPWSPANSTVAARAAVAAAASGGGPLGGVERPDRRRWSGRA